MKVGFARVGNNIEDLLVVDDVIVFSCAKPMVIQPSEIKKVPVGFVLKLQPGYVLNISTHNFLIDKASEIFPSFMTLDHTSLVEPLHIAIRNSSRSQINLHEGDPLAKGFIVKTEKFQVEEFDLAQKVSELPKTKPAKKNSDIKFEVK